MLCYDINQSEPVACALGHFRPPQETSQDYLPRSKWPSGFGESGLLLIKLNCQALAQTLRANPNQVLLSTKTQFLQVPLQVHLSLGFRS